MNRKDRRRLDEARADFEAGRMTADAYRSMADSLLGIPREIVSTSPAVTLSSDGSAIISGGLRCEPLMVDPQYRSDWRAEDASGDNGLAFLLWGFNLTNMLSVGIAARTILSAGWGREDGRNGRTLDAVLYGHDCRHYEQAERLAAAVERLGWERRIPEVGGGYMGRASNPLTEDEAAALQWRLSRGADAVQVVNEILATRPIWEDAVAITVDAEEMVRVTREEEDYRGDGKPEDGMKSQPTGALLADLYRDVHGLIIDPANASAPHCAEEYNAGLHNALGEIGAAIVNNGGEVPEIEADMIEEIAERIAAKVRVPRVEPIKINIPSPLEIAAIIEGATAPIIEAINTMAGQKPKPKKKTSDPSRD